MRSGESAWGRRAMFRRLFNKAKEGIGASNSTSDGSAARDPMGALTRANVSAASRGGC